MKSSDPILNDYTVALRRLADGTVRSFDVVATHAYSAVIIARSTAGPGHVLQRVQLQEWA